MGQQTKKVIKRRRRADYLKRKAESSKLTGTLKKPSVKKSDASEKAPAAKKAAAKKAPAKKAPAKKVAKVAETTEAPATPEVAAESSEA